MTNAGWTNICEERRMLPVRYARHDLGVQIADNILNRLVLLRWTVREGAKDVAGLERGKGSKTVKLFVVVAYLVNRFVARLAKTYATTKTTLESNRERTPGGRSC